MKASVKKKIAEIIKKRGAVVVGAGNTMRGDDGAGPYIASALKQKIGSISCCLPFAAIIDAQEMPENYISKIVDRKPKSVIIIDALDFGAQAGEIRLFKASDIKDATSSTHNMSLGLLARHIEQIAGAEVSFIGIQPHSVKLSQSLSDAVKKSADELIELLCEGAAKNA